MNKRIWKLALTVVLGASVVSAFGQQRGTLSDVVVDKLGIPLYVAGEVLVKFNDVALPREKGLAIATVRGAVAEHIHTDAMRAQNQSGIALLRVPGSVEDAIRALRSDPSVEYAEPNWIYRHTDASNDTYYTNGSLWGMYGDATSPANPFGSQAGEAWNAGRRGSSSVYVGVIDEGVMFNHADLAGNVGPNPGDGTFNGVDNDGNGYRDDVYGWDFVNNDNTVFDGINDDHATHVAGTIGAIGGNGVGVAGVCWQVKIISAKFLGNRGGTTADAIKAVDYFNGLKDRGVAIVATNNSWGGGGFSQGLLDAIVRGANRGILFIASAGNSGANNNTTAAYPANYNTTSGAGYDAVISVASITSTGGLSSFSNYGSTTVDLGAPGSSILSTVPMRSGSSVVSGLAYYSGTSMAAPHVTGAAALYKASNPGATAQQIRNAILSNVVATPSLSGKTVTGGRLNASSF